MIDFDEKLRKALKIYRTQAKLTMYDLGFMAGVAPSLIHMIETGVHKNITLKTLLKICFILKKTPNEMLLIETRKEEPKADQLGLLGDFYR